MRKRKYESFQTAVLTTAPSVEIVTFTAIGKAIKAIAEGTQHIRLLLGYKRLKAIPANITSLAKATYLELELRDNPGLNVKTALKQLAKLPNLKALDLSGLQMRTLPDEIGLLTSLEQLILFSNSLGELPDSMANLTQLKYLNLHANYIRDLSLVYAMPNLERLVLRSNTFSKKGFYQIGELKQLRYLDIWRCGVSRIPEELTRLPHLENLNAGANSIRQLPAGFSNLKSLENVNLRKNATLNWSETFARLASLPRLTHLDLSQYGFEELSPEVGKMQYLRSLNLQDNEVTVLPESLHQLPCLEEVTLNYNPSLDWEQAFEVLGRVGSLKRLELAAIELPVLPDTLGKLTSIESLTIRDMPLLKKLPDTVTKLKNLKYLRVYNCRILTRLPEDIGELDQLETLDIADQSTFFIRLPESVTELSQLKTMYLQGNDVHRLPEKFEKLTQLETLWLGDAFEKFPVEVCALTQLKELNLGGSTIRRLPQEIQQLQNLQVFDYGDCAQLNLTETFEQLAGLPEVTKIRLSRKQLKTLPATIAGLATVEEVDLRGCYMLNLTEAVFVLSKMPRLKVLRLGMGRQALPANMHLLDHLQTVQIDYPEHFMQDNEYLPGGIPLEWGLLEQIQFKSNSTYFDTTNQFIREYGKELYPKERKMFFYGVCTGNFDHLLEYIDDPLKKEGFHLERAIFFVTGKIGGFTQKELKEKFARYGIQVSAKITPRVTHAIIGRFTKPEIVAQIFALPIAIVLEDYLKEFIWSKDQPFLMTADTDMTNHVLDLLMSEDEDNFRLALQIIEGGGANTQIVTYLMVISLFYPDSDIRKEARKLFKKYATSDLQQHVRVHWRASLRDKMQSYYLRQLTQHSDLNQGEFMVMRARISWAGINSNIHRLFLKENIDFSQISLNELPWSLSRLTDVRQVNLSTNDALDFAQVFSVLQQLPSLEELIISRCNITTLPPELYELKQLKKLDIGHNNLVNLPAQMAQLTGLEELVLDGNPLQNIEPGFYRIPELRSLYARNCKLETLASDVQYLTGLKILSLNNNRLKSLPDELAKLELMLELHLTDNQLERLPDGLGKLKTLVRIGLKNNQLKALPNELHWSKIYKLDLENNLLNTLPESITNCRYLNEVKLKGNQINDLPDSLVNLSAFYFNIDISYNGLTEVPLVLSKINQLRTLNLNHNKITFLPDELSKATQLYYLRASNNQIEHLPESFHLMTKLSSIDLSYNQIKELPDQLPPAFQDTTAYRGNFSLHGNPVLPEQKTAYMQKFKGLRF